MKKMKKWIVPLLTVLLIPLTLAGCGTKPTISSSKDRVWYLFDDQMSTSTPQDILIINGNKIIDYGNGSNLSYKDLKGKDAKEVEKAVNNYNKKQGKNDPTITKKEYDVSYSIYTDDNNKTIIEGLETEDGEPYVALKGTKTVTVDGTKLYGFNSIKDGGGYTTLLNNGYLVTDNKDVSLDTKGKNIDQYKVSDFSNFIAENDN